jgi:hypothetical protein
MNLLLVQKQRIDVLEVECQQLRSLVIPQHLDSLSLASNNHGSMNLLHEDQCEEDTMGQDLVPMEVEDIGSPHSSEGQEVQDSCPP